jgi:hypothetical protein
MTYREIQNCFKNHFNRSVKSCWIADVKRQLGLPVRKSYNRKGDFILNPCPEHLIDKLKQIINGDFIC